MKPFIIYIFLVVGFINSAFSQLPSEQVKSKWMIGKMHKAIQSHTDLRFTLFRAERINDKYVKGSFDGKLKTKPFKIYFKNNFPNEGVEILYKDGENSDRAWVNPNSFPFFTMSFSPENKLIRAGGHHTFKMVGFSTFDGLMSRYETIYKEKFYSYVKYLGVVTWEGMTCYKLVFKHPDYKIIKYQTKIGETLKKIALKRGLNIAKLRDLNKEVNPTSALQSGEELLITNTYEKEVIFYIDSKSFLPVYQEIYDEKGLYEKYAYSNLKYKNPIPEDEFSVHYKEYDF
ncbi:MAG: DUF1571 domain-containing protein [Flavobacteriales bacterium]|nr:DUF1571 domain-containing protein [Flavobacteriales bacterium]